MSWDSSIDYFEALHRGSAKYPALSIDLLLAIITLKHILKRAMKSSFCRGVALFLIMLNENHRVMDVHAQLPGIRIPARIFYLGFELDHGSLYILIDTR